MTTLQRVGFIAAVLGLFATGTVANAQINTSLNLDANVGGTATSGKGTAGVKTSVTATGTVQSSGTGTTGTGVNTTVTGTTSTGSTVNSNGSMETFTITRSDITGDTSVTYNPSDVTSAANFQAYARSLVASDENVTKIESNADSVSVWYKEPAKFLGIVPIMITTEARVNVDGSVVIDHPWWYNIFVRDENADDLKASVNTTAGAIVRSENSTTFSSATQARLVNAIHASMKSHNEANVATGTSTDASTY